MTFDPKTWAARYKDNAEISDMNSYMDSGWSGTTAKACDDTQRLLLFELYLELQAIELRPEDFFDRPRLAALLAAVHESRSKPSP